MLIEPTPADPKVEEELRKLQLTVEQRGRLFPHARPFDVDDWVASGPPATPEQIEEMEELLRMRDAEREASLARDAGLAP